LYTRYVTAPSVLERASVNVAESWTVPAISTRDDDTKVAMASFCLTLAAARTGAGAWVWTVACAPAATAAIATDPATRAT
jgi:hypothetical protein